jgi:hypothetical protein
MDKDEQIIQEIKRRAREDIRYGMMTIELKIQDGKIIAGELIEQKVKLG